jgi:manganese/zinc/iron transport system permease protein
MDFGNILYNLIFDYTLRNIALGSAILGIVSGVLGSFALLRRQSLLGDALSHAALPGVVVAFVLSGYSKSPIVLLAGAAAAGWLGAALLTLIVRNTRIKEDTAMGIVLSVFFGTGYMFLSILRRSGSAEQAGLDRYLFGSASSLIASDVETMFVLGAVAIGITVLFFKEFKLLAFDADFMATQGFPVRRVDVLLTSLIVVAIMIGLQTVGVVLMSAMLTAPGASARQWTNRLSLMLGIGVLVGALSGVVGAVVSMVAEIPTGPAIVLALTAATLISFLFGTERGLVWAWLRTRQSQRAIKAETVLLDLYRIAERHKDRGYAAPTGLIGNGKLGRTLQQLETQGLVRALSSSTWALTNDGYSAAQRAAAAHQPVLSALPERTAETPPHAPAFGNSA